MIRRIALFLTCLLSACTAIGGGNQPTPGPTPTLRIVMQADDPATIEVAIGMPQFFDFFSYS